MKKVLGALSILVAFGFMAIPANAEGVAGYVYKNATEAGVGYSTSSAVKVGTAQCKGYFGIVGLGDCSVHKAAANGNIKNVSYYDTYTRNILGYKVVTTKAYGN